MQFVLTFQFVTFDQKKPLQEAFVCKANVRLLRKDHMIKYWQVQEFSSLYQLASELEIGLAGRRVS